MIQFLANLKRGEDRQLVDCVPGVTEVSNDSPKTPQGNRTVPRLRAAVASRRGPRNERNEDSYLMLPERGIFAVCDGMGGHSAGYVASQMTVEGLKKRIDAEEHIDSVAQLCQLVDETNACVYRHARSKLELTGMGCTLVLGWISQPGKESRSARLTTLHVGDSRAYLLRDYGLQQLTEDHSSEVEDLGQAGMLPKKQHALSRAMGVLTEAGVEVNEYDWQTGDQLLLTSDGITDMLANFEITNFLVEEGCFDQKLELLVNEAVQRRGTDDKTGILIEGLESTGE